ncbi:Hypothetical protein PHPALM_18597, partial [Phytophthora palmivora]
RQVETSLPDNQRIAAAKEEKPHDSDEEVVENEDTKEDKDTPTPPNNHDVAAGDFEDQIVRKKHKIALLREQLQRQQTENVELVQEKEDLAEKYLQLQEEAQFLRDINMEDAGAKDEERLQQLELIQTLRSRELELQDELEHQQKKWAIDRDTVHQRIRLLEKEKKLGDDEVARAGSDLAKLQKQHDALQQEAHGLKMTVQEEQDQKLLLVSRIEVGHILVLCMVSLYHPHNCFVDRRRSLKRKFCIWRLYHKRNERIMLERQLKRLQHWKR